MTQSEIRAFVRGTYDIQALRIQTGQRIVANFKTRLGQEPGEREDVLDKEGENILRKIRQEFKRMTDGVASFPRKASFTGTEIISSYTELCLVAEYDDLLRTEEQHFRRLGRVIEDHPLWDAFLKDVRGAGPAVSGAILSTIDISKARHPSSLWKYTGLDVAHDGKGRSRRKEHLVEIDYIDKDGKPAKRNGLPYNPWLKTKLMGVMADCIIKAGESKYERIYRDYKHRLESHAVYGVEKDPKPGHRNYMAKRYMVKMFLVDLYVAWRTLEGLPVSQPYHEAKLGHKHKAA